MAVHVVTALHDGWPVRSCHCVTPLHFMQLLRPLFDAYWPAAHAVHDGLLPCCSVCTAPLYWPSAHSSHVPEAEPPHAVWNWPAGHM